MSAKQQDAGTRRLPRKERQSRRAPRSARPIHGRPLELGRGGRRGVCHAMLALS